MWSTVATVRSGRRTAAACHAQAIERLRARHLMHQVQIDVKDRRLVCGRGHKMLLPHFLKHRLRRSSASYPDPSLCSLRQRWSVQCGRAGPAGGCNCMRCSVRVDQNCSLDLLHHARAWQRHASSSASASAQAAAADVLNCRRNPAAPSDKAVCWRRSTACTRPQGRSVGLESWIQSIAANATSGSFPFRSAKTSPREAAEAKHAAGNRDITILVRNHLPRNR